MSKTVDQIRRENGIKWREIYSALSAGAGDRARVHGRNAMGRARADALAGMKRAISKAAKRQGDLSGWLFEIALCEAMRNAANLQTDIEDFVPTTQPTRSTATQKAA